MKLKDIKSRLREEQAGVEIPDMLPRVKKAPLNKLLSGETPAQAFQKKLAVRLLVTATALLIAAIICFAAMLLFSSEKQAGEHFYISLEIQKEGGSNSFSIVSTKDVSSAICVDDVTGERCACTAISALYALNSGDKVTIAIIGENSSKCATVLNSFKNELTSAYGEFYLATVVTSVNSQEEIDALRSLVEQKGGDPSGGIKELVERISSLM